MFGGGGHSMRQVMIAAVALALSATGCRPVASEAKNEAPPPTEVAPPELTAERARAALIELVRSPEPGELKDFPLERFAGDGVEGGAESPSWGPFSLHLTAREYSYTRTFGQPPRVCRWQYRGGFELRAGRWVALPPRVESQALGPE
jgi:hypothetical protein